MSGAPFPETPRVDALDKVRGKPIFGADDHRPSLLHAALAVSTIAKGRIISLDTKAAAAVRGVRLLLTHELMGTVKSAGFIMGGGYAFQSFQPMLSPTIAYRGQPIALVAAELVPLPQPRVSRPVRALSDAQHGFNDPCKDQDLHPEIRAGLWKYNARELPESAQIKKHIVRCLLRVLIL